MTHTTKMTIMSTLNMQPRTITYSPRVKIQLRVVFSGEQEAYLHILTINT